MCRRIGPLGSGELPEELTEKRYHALFVNLTNRERTSNSQRRILLNIKAMSFRGGRGISCFLTANYADFTDFRLRILRDGSAAPIQKSNRLRFLNFSRLFA